MTRHMAVEWGQHGIRVMCVAPGPIADTEGLRKLGNLPVYISRSFTSILSHKHFVRKNTLSAEVKEYSGYNKQHLFYNTTLLTPGAIQDTHTSNNMKEINKCTC